MHHSFGDTVKGVSDLKARFVYSYHNAGSCENVKICLLAQTAIKTEKPVQ